MSDFWDRRAREDAYFFIDNRRAYGDPELAAFWSEGETDLDKILDLLGAAIEPDDVALDIGCGVGRLTRVLAARGREAIGLDVSGEMLSRAARHNEHLTNISWVHGDGTGLKPLTDASVDVVVSHVVFQHIPDPAVTMGYVAEIGRVLRPGGWAGFQVSNDPRVHRPRNRSRALSHLREGALSLLLPGAMRRGPRGQDDPAWLGSAIELDQLRTVAAQAGLDLETVLGEGTQFCLVLARRRGG